MTTSLSKSQESKFGTLGWFVLGVAGAVGLGYLMRSRSARPELARFAGMGAGPTSGADAAKKLEPNWHEGRDGVEEASWESFPASDPPSF